MRIKTGISKVAIDPSFGVAGKWEDRQPEENDPKGMSDVKQFLCSGL